MAKVNRTLSHRQWELQQRAKGLCMKCGRKLAKGNASYCKQHAAQRRQYTQKYYRADRETSYRRTRRGAHMARLRVLQMLGPLRCAWCGEDDYRVLTIDHANGVDRSDTNRRRPDGRRAGFKACDYLRILRGEVDISDLRILCANCQTRNEYQRGKRDLLPEVEEAIIAAGGHLPRLKKHRPC